MATKKRSDLEEELMTPANIERVIKLLNPEDGVKAGTKKDACQILGMAYNTTRLATIIEDYQKKVLREKERRAALRGTPATKDEISFLISEYLEGVTIDSISDSLFRPSSFIRKVLAEYGVPIRATSHDYFKPELVPELSRRDRFALDEVVYSMRYASKAIIEKETMSKGNLGYIYRVWLSADKWKEHAWTEAHELASLSQFTAMGIKV